MVDKQNNSEVMEDNSETRADGRPTAKVTPSRKSYSSVASDVSIPSALGELLDNSLDSAALEGINPVEVTLEHRTLEDGTEELVYRDAAGGVKQGDMGVFLGLGRSREERADDQNVGTFGIGAKKALKRLGDRLTIGSRHLRADQGWQYTVEPEWFETTDEDDDPSQWEFPLEEVDLEEGATELRIQELSFDWEHHREEIVTWIRTTYRKFIDPDTDLLTLELTIKDEDGTVTVDDEGEVVTVDDGSVAPLSPPPAVEWTYSPWLGGLHPRQYTGLEFHDPDWSGPIQARVTVGLLREGSGQQSGTFIYCQNRLIESNLMDEKGGYGITRDGLNKFNPSQHKRLRIEIELFGDASDLPWNSDKSRIRSSHKALSYTEKGVHWWLRRMADRHMAAGKYGAFDHTAAVFEPYAADNEHVTRSEPESIDVADKHEDIRAGKKDQIRIYGKPSNDFSEITDLAQLATAHAQLGIVAETMTDMGMADWARPTYEIMLGAEFKEAYYDGDAGSIDSPGAELLTDDPQAVLSAIDNPDDDDSETSWAVIAKYLTEVSDLPDVASWDIKENDVDDVDAVQHQLKDAAGEDINRGDVGERRLLDTAWRQPLYDAYLQGYLDGRDTDQSVADLPTYEDDTSSDTSDSNEGGPDRSEGEETTEDSTLPLDCPDCGAELTGNTCDECGFEFDVADDGSDGDNGGNATVEAFDADDAVKSIDRGSDATAAADTDGELTLEEFCRAHVDLFDEELSEELLADAGALERFLVEYISEQQEKISVAHEYVDIDRLVEAQQAGAD